MNLRDGKWENPQISSNNNGQNLFFWACKTEHQQQIVQQTIVLTKTAGQQPSSGHLLRPRYENVLYFRRVSRHFRLDTVDTVYSTGYSHLVSVSLLTALTNLTSINRGNI